MNFRVLQNLHQKYAQQASNIYNESVVFGIPEMSWPCYEKRYASKQGEWKCLLKSLTSNFSSQ